MKYFILALVALFALLSVSRADTENLKLANSDGDIRYSNIPWPRNEW